MSGNDVCAVNGAANRVAVATMNEMENATAGWHPDPVRVGQLRWWNGNEWSASVDKSWQAIPRDKSVGVAFVLTFFFGPFGLFYVSTPVALIALVVSFMLLVLTLGSSLFLTWFAIIILGCVLASWRHSQYQAWLLKHLAGPGEPSLSTRSWWRTPSRAPRRSPIPTVTEPYVAFGDSASAVQVNGPPGWRPDPTGRFEVRWWNGKIGTTHVMNGGYRATDPFGGRPEHSSSHAKALAQVINTHDASRERSDVRASRWDSVVQGAQIVRAADCQ
jgi:hypothetical protein